MIISPFFPHFMGEISPPNGAIPKRMYFLPLNWGENFPRVTERKRWRGIIGRDGRGGLGRDLAAFSAIDTDRVGVGSECEVRTWVRTGVGVATGTETSNRSIVGSVGLRSIIDHQIFSVQVLF